MDQQEIERRLNKLEKENQQIKEQNKRLKQIIQQHTNTSNPSSTEQTELSRRSFLKKIGAGALGLGAMSLAPAASKMTISDTGIYRDGSKAFLDLPGSNSMTGTLDMGSHNITNAGSISTGDLSITRRQLADLDQMLGFWADSHLTKDPSNTGSISYLIDEIKIREPGDASGAATTQIFNEGVGFDPTISGSFRIDLSSVNIDNYSDARIIVGLADNVPTTNLNPDDYVQCRVLGDGSVRSLTSDDGTPSGTLDSSQDNTFANNLKYIELSWDGSQITTKVSDGSTDVSVSEGGNYPTGEHIYPEIFVQDKSGSASRTIDIDIDGIELRSQ